ncbi:hypothetical protein [Nocardia sp. 348MFTsu5.1]|uniref:hypothetical protein n=1 Tax=Nocardia sp. 348MFTsu5.1 TaxID=1172185 RepID=UPI0003682EAC|nr:hypothetical protein [Nocardia sp. 348MFTsu5.1]
MKPFVSIANDVLVAGLLDWVSIDHAYQYANAELRTWTGTGEAVSSALNYLLDNQLAELGTVAEVFTRLPGEARAQRTAVEEFTQRHPDGLSVPSFELWVEVTDEGKAVGAKLAKTERYQW